MGAIGWYAEIRAAAEWLAELHDRNLTAWDDFDSASGGVLGSLAGKHRLTPPSVHPRAEIRSGWPEIAAWEDPLHLLVLAAGNLEPLSSVPARVLDGCVLVGHLEDLRDLAKSKRLRYEPLRHVLGHPWLSVRVRRA